MSSKEHGKTPRTQTPLAKLTWDDLREWAGSKIVNRGKCYTGNVYDLAKTENSGFAAWVSGSEDYATSVKFDENGELDWSCSCPYDDGPCKHAVAVILAGLELEKSGGPIPLLDKESDLALVINGDGYEEDEFDDDEDEPEPEHPETAKPVALGKQTALMKILGQKSKDELLEMLMDVAGRHPEVKRRILENDQLNCGKTDKLIVSLKKEIRAVTSENAWYDHWWGEGNQPDYSHIQEQLAALLKKGHADAVVELGLALWKGGSEQVGESNDDGHTADEVASCLEVVFRAVTQSSMSRPKQLLWMINILLGDEYSLGDSCERFLNGGIYTKSDWSELAAELDRRLKTMPPPGSGYSGKYRRERIMLRLIQALERSGQKNEVLPLLEREVHATQCYTRLVDWLLEADQSEKARTWCIKGFRETIKDAPGIATNLQKRLRELADREQRFDLVAAYRAEDFFASPSARHYIELKKATEKIKCWSEVRTAALGFLECGRRPDCQSAMEEKTSWSLPRPEVYEGQGNKRFRRQYPDLDVLIDIAILEKRFADAIKLYQAQQSKGGWGIGRGLEVAEAVAKTHPDTSLGIWKKAAEGEIRQVKPKAYEVAAGYLRKLRKVYTETNRLPEWQSLLAALRAEHKAKRRLLEVLDDLESKRIIGK